MAKGEHTNTVAITPATSLCKVSRLPVNKECRGGSTCALYSVYSRTLYVCSVGTMYVQ